MPFDPSPPDLSMPSIEGLAWVLRHREAWPKRHNWDFSITLRPRYTQCWRECGTAGCALGIAKRLWGIEASDYAAANLFGISTKAADAIFYGGAYGVATTKDVTPEMVADMIDRKIADGSIRRE